VRCRYRHQYQCRCRCTDHRYRYRWWWSVRVRRTVSRVGYLGKVGTGVYAYASSTRDGRRVLTCLSSRDSRRDGEVVTGEAAGVWWTGILNHRTDRTAHGDGLNGNCTGTRHFHFYSSDACGDRGVRTGVRAARAVPSDSPLIEPVLDPTTGRARSGAVRAERAGARSVCS
jgi:hypothetical protein